MNSPSTASKFEQEHKLKESQLKASIYDRFGDTGEKERLKELLKKRLIECGWRDEMRKHTKTVLKNKGIEKTNLEDLVNEISPKARDMVPDDVKAEMLKKIREFMDTID